MREISKAEMEVYRRTARERQALKEEKLANRMEQARSVATAAAAWLRQNYDVEQVWLFGSLVHKQWFTMTSDIDLAIAQLAPNDYWLAVARLQDISPDFKVDLVRLDSIPDSFKNAIMSESEAL